MKFKINNKTYNGFKIIKALCVPFALFMISTMFYLPLNLFTQFLAVLTPIATFLAMSFITEFGEYLENESKK